MEELKQYRGCSLVLLGLVLLGLFGAASELLVKPNLGEQYLGPMMITGMLLAFLVPFSLSRGARWAKIFTGILLLILGVALTMFLVAPSYAWFLAACVVWSMASGVSGAASSSERRLVSMRRSPRGPAAVAVSGTVRFVARCTIGVPLSLFLADTSLVARRMACEENIQSQGQPNAPFGSRFHAPTLWGFQPDFAEPSV